jgi:lysozyme
MKTSAAGIALIKHYEGVRQKPYRCPALLWTIGVGHVLYPEQVKLSMKDRMSVQLRPEDNRIWSLQEVDEILKTDLRRFEKGVGKLIPVYITQGQFDALVSFSFNLGLGSLQRSTLRQKIIQSKTKEAAREILKYCMSNGKVLRGLQLRRKDEQVLFLSL